MKNRRYYRNRSKPQTVESDLEWLVNAREALREADKKAFPAGQQWPLRAAQMDKVIGALGRLQLILFSAIEEVNQELGRTEPRDTAPWLGYPPR